MISLAGQAALSELAVSPAITSAPQQRPTSQKFRVL